MLQMQKKKKLTMEETFIEKEVEEDVDKNKTSRTIRSRKHKELSANLQDILLPA